MKIRKVVFEWENLEKSERGFKRTENLKIVFEEWMERPILFIDAGIIKIEDNSLYIDVKEVLSKIGKIDFEQLLKEKRIKGFNRDSWRLIINDEFFDGKFEEPLFLKECKKIIRFNVLLDYANKKIANYLK